MYWFSVCSVIWGDLDNPPKSLQEMLSEGVRSDTRVGVLAGFEVMGDNTGVTSYLRACPFEGTKNPRAFRL